MDVTYRNLSTLGKCYSILSSSAAIPILSVGELRKVRLGVLRLSIFYSQTCRVFSLPPTLFHTPITLSSVPSSQLTLKLTEGCAQGVCDLQVILEDKPSYMSSEGSLAG